ncbi:MAG: hypothetical protein KBA46_06370 [Candidatus Omnitrophica bacterium]|nr:hypothetical protein [Candidatus Omnitrophota bacterium]
MIKYLWFWLGLVWIIPVFAQEHITIATYYPSPMGEYLDLRVAGTLRLRQEPTAATSARLEWITTDATQWVMEQQGGDLRFSSLSGGTFYPGLSINPETASDQGLLLTQGRGFPFDIVLRGGAVNNQLDAGDVIFQTGAGAERARIWSHNGSDNELRMGTYRAGSPHVDLMIDQNGNTGIGRSDTRAQLDVAGAIGIGDEAIRCTRANAGVTRFHDNKLEVCREDDSGDWNWLGVGSLSTRITHGSCPEGYKLTGGSCSCSSHGSCLVTVNEPFRNGWRCSGHTTGGASITTYAICSRIE